MPPPQEVRGVFVYQAFRRGLRRSVLERFFDERGAWKRFALLGAADAGHLQRVMRLLDKGVDPDGAGGDDGHLREEDFGFLS